MADARPASCRNRLRDEGKPYGKSGCKSCRDGGLYGCPHEGNRVEPPFTRDDPARVNDGPEVDEVLLSRCVTFVAEQGEGEWGDDLVNKDARKLHDFVRKLQRERVGAGDIEAIVVEAEEAVHDDGGRWRLFCRKFRALLVSKAE